MSIQDDIFDISAELQEKAPHLDDALNRIVSWANTLEEENVRMRRQIQPLKEAMSVLVKWGLEAEVL